MLLSRAIAPTLSKRVAVGSLKTSCRSFWSSSNRGGWRKPNILSNNPDNLLWGIVGTNVLVFCTWKMAEGNRGLYRFMMQHFTCSGVGVFRLHNYHTVITSTFSHKDVVHLLFNMVTFFTFGRELVYALGSARFLALYLGGGVISSICQTLWPRIVPRSWPAWRDASPYTVSLGASGAINAVVAWSILAYPRNMLFLYGVLPVPAALLGLGFIGVDAYNLYYGGSGMGNAAHLSGAIFGGIMFALSRGRRRF